MNPEAKEIIAFMKKRCPSNPVSPTDVHNYMSIQTARLLFLIAEEQEKSAAKMEQQTDRLVKQTDALVRFTRRLLLFTIALFVLGAIQILVAF